VLKIQGVSFVMSHSTTDSTVYPWRMQALLYAKTVVLGETIKRTLCSLAVASLVCSVPSIITGH